jgi:hypothetical protein
MIKAAVPITIQTIVDRAIQIFGKKIYLSKR